MLRPALDDKLWMGNPEPNTPFEVRSFHLVPGTITYIDSLLESGAYLSAGEIVRAALRALQERDAAVERWLSEDVASVLDAVQAEERRVVPAATVFASVRARYADRRKKHR